MLFLDDARPWIPGDLRKTAKDRRPVLLKLVQLFGQAELVPEIPCDLAARAAAGVFST